MKFIDQQRWTGKLSTNGSSASHRRSDEEERLLAESATTSAAARSDRSPWNWLLLFPIVLPLLTPLYNHLTPRLFGFPAFYWLQFLFILVGVTTTIFVYRMTRRVTR